MTIGRIRVLVAGDVYVNRSSVRPFLEDDGYDVVGEPLTRDEALSAVGAQQLDAVVIDDRLLSSRGNGRLLHKVRRAAPEAKVVVISSAAGRPKGVAGVDAYLESGMSLAALSAILGGLFASEDPSSVLPAGAAAAAGAAALADRSSEPRGGVARFVAAVGMPILMVWALIAVVTTGAGTPVPRVDVTDLGGEVLNVPQGIGPLDDARDSLERVIAAMKAGNYALAAAHATALMDQRETAIAAGYLTDDLDSQIRLRLAGLVAAMPPGMASTMQGILGNLFPVLEHEGTPGGGSGLIIGPVVDAGAPPSGGAGTTSGGGQGGGGGGGDASGGGDGGDGGGGGGGGDGGGGGGDGDCHAHGNGSENGNGHEEHGNGNGFGHDECDEAVVKDVDSGDHGNHGHGHGHGGGNGHGGGSSDDHGGDSEHHGHDDGDDHGHRHDSDSDDEGSDDD